MGTLAHVKNLLGWHVKGEGWKMERDSVYTKNHAGNSEHAGKCGDSTQKKGTYLLKVYTKLI